MDSEKDNLNQEPDIQVLVRAANKGRAVDQYMLGHFYHRGIYVEQSYEEAIKWLTKSADQGYPKAQETLAQIYLEKNDKKAVKYLQQVAERGNAEVQIFLGRAYQFGNLDLSRSVETAIKYYKLAAAQGNKEAQELLELAQEFLEAEEEIESNFNILLNKYNQSSNSAERKRLYGKLVDISSEFEQLTGKKLLDEATIAEGCDCGTVNGSGSKSGCMVLAVLMLSPVVAAACYGIYSLLA